MNWTAPTRPKEHAERALLAAILDGTFAPGSNLPGERNLATQLGVTRPTLREAIQRLARDGWLSVSQGKPTLVNDYWQAGGLNVLSALVVHSDQLPPNFVCNLLEVRLNLAPAYTSLAVAAHSQKVAGLLDGAVDLPDTAAAYASFDWTLHQQLTIWSGNPIYTLILNGFAGFYEDVAAHYFAPSVNRTVSRDYYQELRELARQRKPAAAAELTRTTMQQSIILWEQQAGSTCVKSGG